MIGGMKTPFRFPEALQLRRSSAQGVEIFRLGIPGKRFELNILFGPLLAITKIATPTRVSYYPPAGRKEMTFADKRMVGKMLLGALGADAVVDTEGSPLENERREEGKTPKGIEFCHHAFFQRAGGHQATTILLPAEGDTAAVVAIRAGAECVAEAEGYLRGVVDTFEF